MDYFTRAGIDFVAGEREGIYLSDLDGKRLINCHSNGGVFNLGHRNPRIIAALGRALNHYDIGNHHLIRAPRARLAERLAADEKIRRYVSGAELYELMDASQHVGDAPQRAKALAATIRD